jgi:hypothetical protein
MANQFLALLLQKDLSGPCPLSSRGIQILLIDRKDICRKDLICCIKAVGGSRNLQITADKR